MKAAATPGRIAATRKPTTYHELIVEAIMGLKDRGGSTRSAIENAVRLRKQLNYKAHHLRNALRHGVGSGKFVHVKGRFSLSCEERDKNRRYVKLKLPKPIVASSPTCEELLMAPMSPDLSLVRPPGGLEELDQEAKRWGELYQFY